jgi:hypothetical protein
MFKTFRLRRSIDKIDLNVRLSALENQLEQHEQRFGYALSSGEAERAKADLLGIVKLAAEHLNRAEEGHAEVRAELESLRVELQHFRTTIGAATGIDLASH